MRARGAGAHERLVRPALDTLLPDVAGRRALDLGCGDGWLCRELAARGAASVVGVDPSRRMLELAGERTSEPCIRFLHGFVEDVELTPASADLVTSVLVLHYVADLPATLARIARWLAPGGVLVALVEHPAFTAPTGDPELLRGGGTPAAWPLRDYFEEGERRRRWFVDGVVRCHRTLATIVNALLDAGLLLDRLLEPAPAGAAAGDEDRVRPLVLAVRASVPSAPRR